MSNVLLLTSARESSADIVPSLSLLPHAVRVAPVAAEQVAASKPVPPAPASTWRRDIEVRDGRELAEFPVITGM